MHSYHASHKISSWHHNEHIVPTFVRCHIPASNFAWVITSSCICVQHTFVLQTAYLLFSCSLMHDPCIFLYKTKIIREAWKFMMHSWLQIFGTMSQSCWDHKPVSLKKKRVNMVPNAWLTRKWCFFEHLNFIITFSMHSTRIPESFISMKYCWSIGDRNCHSLDYGVEPSSCFYENVHQVKLKHGSNNLSKIGAKDGSSYIAASSTAKHI